MPQYCLGSFPNSRVSPRPATQRAETETVTVGNTNTLIAAANPNRTYLTIKNNGNEPMNYGYEDLVTLATSGFQLQPGEGIDIDSPGEVWGVVISGTSTEMSVDEGSG